MARFVSSEDLLAGQCPKLFCHKNRDFRYASVTMTILLVVVHCFTGVSALKHGHKQGHSLLSPAFAVVPCVTRPHTSQPSGIVLQGLGVKPAHPASTRRAALMVRLSKNQDDEYYYPEESFRRQPQESKQKSEQSRPLFKDSGSVEDLLNFPLETDREQTRGYGGSGRINRQKGEREFLADAPNQRYDNNEDEYGADDKDYDGDETLAGNFWSNPLQDMDPYPQGADQRRRSTPRPPSTAGSQEQRRRRSVPRSRRGASEDNYGTPPRQRTTFRSGTPQPPAPIRDFYNRLFWYGFDNSETTGPEDRTMFGGTRGKFNGLDLLREGYESGPNAISRRKKRTKQQPQFNNDEYDESFDDEFAEEDYDDDDMFERKEDDERAEKRMRSPPPPSFEYTQSEARARRRPRYDEDENSPMDYIDAFRNKLDSNKADPDWVAGEVSGWFDDTPDQRDDYGYEKNEESFDEVDRGTSPSRRGPVGGRKRRKRGLSGFFDAIFNIDDNDMQIKAEEYNQNLGLGRKQRQPQQPQRGRRGYAYPYTDKDEARSFTQSYNDDDDDFDEIDDVIDVDHLVDLEREAALAFRSREQSSSKDDEQRKGKAWEERAQAIDRVPPKGVAAWGPMGEVIGGVDIRTAAALEAMEEIREAKRKLENKQERAIDAEEKLIILKSDAGLYRKRLESLQNKVGKSIKARLREINMDIEDAGRRLRLARAEVKAANDQVEELEDKHWALLRQYEADEVFSRSEDAVGDCDSSSV
mmetsp:Transcript_21261/g.38409  ORF Transcript_21261/g.38409 Transcript_21261/m.38409 type:complete len:753 (-) Transcript_21261:481-2739(-)